MGFARSVFVGFSLFVLSSLLIAQIRGVEGGVYVFATNIMLIPIWGMMVLWSGYGEKAADAGIVIVTTSFVLFLVALGVLVGVYHDFERAIAVIVVFIMFSIPLFLLNLAKRKAGTRGKNLTYPPTDVRYFWFYQWLIVITMSIKAEDSLMTFLRLLPALIGGYLIIDGLVKLELNATSQGEGPWI